MAAEKRSQFINAIQIHMIYFLLAILLFTYSSMVHNSKLVIRGCEARGDAQDAYLSRWTLFITNPLRCYFHKFHRSDADDLHDHPWSFITVILWRGYYDVTFASDPSSEERRRKRIYPGMILYRPASHSHRVELCNGKPAYTLVFTFKRVQTWGFYVGGVWRRYRQYFIEKGC